MGIRGAKPKPAVVKALTRSGKAALRLVQTPDPEVQSVNLADFPPPPELNARAVECWNYAIQHAPKGVLATIDRALLAQYAEAEAVMYEMIDKMNKEGVLYLSMRDGEEKATAFWRTFRQAGDQVRACAAELGFTPIARARIGNIARGKSGETEDPWGKLASA